MVAIIVTTQREIIKEEAFVRFLLRLCSLPQSIVPTYVLSWAWTVLPVYTCLASERTVYAVRLLDLRTT